MLGRKNSQPSLCMGNEFCNSVSPTWLLFSGLGPHRKTISWSFENFSRRMTESENDAHYHFTSDMSSIFKLPWSSMLYFSFFLKFSSRAEMYFLKLFIAVILRRAVCSWKEIERKWIQSSSDFGDDWNESFEFHFQKTAAEHHAKEKEGIILLLLFFTSKKTGPRCKVTKFYLDCKVANFWIKYGYPYMQIIMISNTL